MAQITIDTDEFGSMRNMSQEEWQEFAKKAIKDKMKRIAESERFTEIISKSKATEQDVKELTDEIKEAVWKRHKASREHDSKSS